MPGLQVGDARRDLMLAVAIATIAFAAISGYSVIRQLHADASLSLPRDLQPGLRVPGPIYAPPEGCQVRDWKVGEFLSSTCYVDQEIPRRLLAGYGLEAPSNVYWPVRHHLRMAPNYLERFWVRVGPDAVLVSAPSRRSGRILLIVRDRFPKVDTFAMAAATAADARDYASPPPDYVRQVRRNLWTAPLVALAMTAFLWAIVLVAPKTDPQAILAEEFPA